MLLRPRSGRSFFLSTRASVGSGLAVAALMVAALGVQAQTTDPAAAPPASAVPAQNSTPDLQFSNIPGGKPAKTVQSNPKPAVKNKDNPLGSVDSKQPDKVLYDKAIDAMNHGRYDVARLDLQTLLNTYYDSEYQMRAKLAIADSWFKEGGSAAYTQAEQEYKDFITFFPNAPEAAEAQLRVGDIYFHEMDKPDRDYTKAIHAEEEYRLLLQQFPESILVPQATQRLREVQEMLATRETTIAEFYASHQNWPATIARYQTVVDTYPLYSHMDETLIGLGDAYAAEARFIRTIPLPEAGRARLEKIYDDQAANAYRKVILEHSATRGVEDARDRLSAMNLPIPTPTPEQIAASTALENSRGQYTLSKRAVVLFLHTPDTVQAATIGAPPLDDAKATYAPAVIKQITTDIQTSMSPAVNNPPVANAPAPAIAPTAAVAVAPPPVEAAPLQFQDVPTAATGGGAAVNTNVPSNVPATSYTGGSGVGIEIVPPGSSPTAAPTSNGTTFPTADPNGGLKAVGPTGNTALPPVEKPAAAPDAINDLTPGAAAPAAAAAEPAKPPCDQSDESCSKHKKKKGLAKLNPF